VIFCQPSIDAWKKIAISITFPDMQWVHCEDGWPASLYFRKHHMVDHSRNCWFRTRFR